MINANDLHQF